MDKIAVLIPCYNEAPTIRKVIEDTKKVLPEATIYIYDNNSSDGTAEIAKEAGAIVRFEHRQGKGNVIRSMFREIDAVCYLMLDGDDTYPLENAREMCEKVLRNNTDMVVGDRLSSTYFTENKRLFHNFGNSLVRFAINRLFKGNIKDIMTGYRAMSYRFVKTFPVLSRNFEIETEMTIHAIEQNFTVDNVIIEYRDRQEGSESKLNTYSDGFKVLMTILRMYRCYRPLPFFSTIAIILFAIALAFFIPVFGAFLTEGVVRRLPTLIAIGFCMIAGIICFFNGLLLSTLVQQDRRNFEFKLLLTENEFKHLLEKEGIRDYGTASFDSSKKIDPNGPFISDVEGRRTGKEKRL